MHTRICKRMQRYVKNYNGKNGNGEKSTILAFVHLKNVKKKKNNFFC